MEGNKDEADTVFKAFANSFEKSSSHWQARDEYLSDIKQDKNQTTAELDIYIKDLIRRCQFPPEDQESHKIDLLYHATAHFKVRKFVHNAKQEELKYDRMIQVAKAHERTCQEYQIHKQAHSMANPSNIYANSLIQTNALSKSFGPPFNGKEFSSYLTGLGIRHTTSSPNYPRSNGFLERQIQTVKRLIEKANSSRRSHQEALTGLRAQPLGDGLPSPSEILHERSLVTRKASPVDLTVVRQSLIALQAKYTKSQDKAKQTKTQRALVIGEEVYFLSGKNEWQIGIVTGTTDTGRSYNILTDEGTSLRRNRSHLKPRCHDIPIISCTLPSRTATPSQSEITGKPLPEPKHPPKVKYSYNNKQNISFQDQYEQHPPKVYFPNNNVPKLVIRRVGDTAYDSYIAETLYPLKSAIKPRKQTRFAGDPVSSVKTIPARRTRSHPPKWTIKAEDPYLLIPLELSQSRANSDLNQDLGGDLSVVSPRESHQSEETLPTVPLGQFQAHRSDNTTTKSIAHFQSETPSQSEINSTITENIVENIVTSQITTPSQR